MNAIRNILLLIGSPKGAKSVSDALGSYLFGMMTASGAEGRKIFIQPALKADPGGKELVEAFERADMILLVSPLYIDSLPYPVIKALEILASAASGKPAGRKSLVALSNSGFPEAGQNTLALDMCRQFAKEAGLVWKGGFALGGGQAVAGKDLKQGGRMVRHIQKALQIAAEALIKDMPVPEEAVKLMAHPVGPTWLYLFMGNLGWKIRAWRNGVMSRLWDRPYLSHD
jgi:NAD(P)H-dependent FMN reductase